MQVERKIAAVTGAGTGIGQAAAVALARAGFTVALLGRRIDPLLATQEIVERAGGVAAAIPTDVSDEAS
ncbi:SDR family NAD(P)-dependent oxidoreductase, partial [Burkholderia cenocepacia]